MSLFTIDDNKFWVWITRGMNFNMPVSFLSTVNIAVASVTGLFKAGSMETATINDLAGGNTTLINGVNPLTTANIVASDLNQPVLTTSSPTFNGLTTTGTAILNAVRSANYNDATGGTTALINGVNPLTTATIVIADLNQAVKTTSTPTFANVIDSGLTANGAIVANAGQQLISTVLGAGQLLIGTTASTPSAASLTGTVNQVIVTGSSGGITLSLPQDLNTGSNVAFGTVSAVGGTSLFNNVRLVGINDTTGGTTAVINGVNPLTTANTLAANVNQGVLTTSSPSFGAETLTNTTNQITLGAASHTSIINAVAPAAASQTISLPDPGGAANVIYDVLAQTISGVKTFSNSPIFSGLSSTNATATLLLSTTGTNVSGNYSVGANASAVFSSTFTVVSGFTAPGSPQTISMLWSQVGNVVTVTGQTAAAGATPAIGANTASVTLPITRSTNFANITSAFGTVTGSNGTTAIGFNGYVTSVNGAKTALINLFASATTACQISFSFQYIIV